MKQWMIIFLIALLHPISGHCQTKLKRPKLVIGIVVDQMRYDYLTRFYDHYQDEGGFKYLINNGINFTDMHYNYAPTTTGPGHATIWSGASPAFSGIANNHFYLREEGRKVYCVNDEQVNTIGQNNGSGKKSPHRMLVSNLGDELKLSNNHQSKVISVSLKDRSAILPAGYMADGAYWYDGGTGNFVSSSFYMDELPKWVKDYNRLKRSDELLKQPWELLLPSSAYSVSLSDDNPYEGTFYEEQKPTFPHDLPTISKKMRKDGRSAYYMLMHTPHGNTLVSEMAKQAIISEQMGKHDFTDLLAISYSSTDKIGHQFAPASMEIQDTYLRLDRELGGLLKFVDQEVGMQDVLIFLTADHAGAQNAMYMVDKKFHNAKYVQTGEMVSHLQQKLTAKYGEGKWVLDMEGEQIYLNRKLINEKGLELNAVQNYASQLILTQPSVQDAVSLNSLQSSSYENHYKELLANGAHPTRSGDVFIIFHTGVILGKGKTGTSHSMTYNYDTHVPLLMMGFGLPKGVEISDKTRITQIAPTISNKMKISAPSCAFSPVLPIHQLKETLTP
ncbi:alkaline phosphatase PafA [Persicobacter psychrovividus]|uniref:Alkaline phosphatase family protein n=1 Tax=Persicobacter psychrovividus TaxID=387638 RepID=A0ABM7VLZ9_9BACT|nr:alkaline phosphatase family protein [Persicobacter psychrovividus]